MLPVSHLLAGLVCALTAAALAPVATRSVKGLVSGLAGLALALAAWAAWGLPGREALGWAAGLGAAAVFAGQGRASLASAGASGLLTGLWIATLTDYGLPMWVAVPQAIVPVVLASAWSSRPGFAPRPVMDEALAAGAVLGPLVAVAPGIVDGWRAAGALTAAPAQSEMTVPVWALVATGASLAAGVGRAMWSRR